MGFPFLDMTTSAFFSAQDKDSQKIKATFTL